MILKESTETACFLLVVGFLRFGKIIDSFYDGKLKNVMSSMILTMGWQAGITIWYFT